jgi:FtsZ-interacting cell division protein ZipA
MNNAVWIVIAVIAALVLIAALLWAGGRKRAARHRNEAEEIREQLRHEDAEVRSRESIAVETEARARAAAAEADAKSAEAERLHDAAQAHRSDVIASREQLAQRHQQAEALDPRGSVHKDSLQQDRQLGDREVPQQSEVRRERRG